MIKLGRLSSGVCVGVSVGVSRMITGWDNEIKKVVIMSEQ